LLSGQTTIRANRAGDVTATFLLSSARCSAEILKTRRVETSISPDVNGKISVPAGRINQILNRLHGTR
jgi:hypothetical protein